MYRGFQSGAHEALKDSAREGRVNPKVSLAFTLPMMPIPRWPRHALGLALRFSRTIQNQGVVEDHEPA